MITRSLNANVLLPQSCCNVLMRKSDCSNASQTQARQIIAECVNAKITGRASQDCVLFTGTGATSACAKLVQVCTVHKFVYTTNTC
jgi:hypothetical protein